MQNAAPNGSGAVLLGGNEQPVPTQNRPILQANAAMRARLKLLLWGYKNARSPLWGTRDRALCSWRSMGTIDCTAKWHANAQDNGSALVRSYADAEARHG